MTKTLCVLGLVLAACGGSTNDNGGNGSTKTGTLGGGDTSGTGVTPSNPNTPTTTMATTFPTNGKHVFVTSAIYTGNLGGIAGANTKCQTAATAASLPGTYHAWISTSTVNAIDNVTGEGPWYDGNANKIFANRANLATTALTTISTDENGNSASSGGSIWTGTTTGGTMGALLPFEQNEGVGGSANCADFVSTTDYGIIGLNQVGGQYWTQGFPTSSEIAITTGSAYQSCASQFSLYCFEE